MCFCHISTSDLTTNTHFMIIVKVNQSAATVCINKYFIYLSIDSHSVSRCINIKFNISHNKQTAWDGQHKNIKYIINTFSLEEISSYLQLCTGNRKMVLRWMNEWNQMCFFGFGSLFSFKMGIISSLAWGKQEDLSWRNKIKRGLSGGLCSCWLGTPDGSKWRNVNGWFLAVTKSTTRWTGNPSDRMDDE